MVHIAHKLACKIYGNAYSTVYNLCLKALVFTDFNIKLRVDFDIFHLISVCNVLYIHHHLLFINGASENIQIYLHYHFLSININ